MCERSYQRRIMGIATWAALVSGCDLSPTSKVPPPLPTAKSLNAPSPVKSPAEGDSAAIEERNFDGAIFQVPTAWEEVPKKNDMIMAEFRVNGLGGPARLTLSTASGGLAANLDRWKGQFLRSPDDPAPKESTLSVAGKEATLVELFGTFRDGFGGGDPQPDSAMLGVVIPLSATNYFVKLTGPRDTVTEARDTFLKFVETAKFKE